MYKFKFSFTNGGLEHYWFKILYSKEESNILNYLESKTFPFEITISDIKWKILQK